jgi:lysozyme family protein
VPVASETKVPWHVIGVIHALEASFNFLGHLHNGDVPLDQPTRHVPKGRPDPWSTPNTWEKDAKDALVADHFANLSDWSLERTLYRVEGYNGFGYRSRQVNGRRVNSPYLWSFSDQYEKGKFTADGKWSSNAVSQQCGAAVMIYELVRRGAVHV